MTAHHHPTEARPLYRPSREEVQAAIETLLCADIPYEAREVVKDRFISKARMSDLKVRAREQREMAHRYFRTGCPNQGRSWMRSALRAWMEFNRLRKEL